jgi:hypothetical protein
MLELKFEEVKGLQDLGFTFSNAEVDTELASIVLDPSETLQGGEQQQGHDVGSNHVLRHGDGNRRRINAEEVIPYLSEARDVELTSIVLDRVGNALRRGTIGPRYRLPPCPPPRGRKTPSHVPLEGMGQRGGRG